MSDMMESVAEFMLAADQYIPLRPGAPPAKVAANRLAMLLEEVEETARASGFASLVHLVAEWEEDRTYGDGLNSVQDAIGRAIDSGRYDVVESVDGYLDIAYVAHGGTLENAGRAAFRCQDEVIQNNATKILPDGNVLKSDAGKVLKPPTHIPADVRGVLAYHNYRQEF